MNPSLLTQDLTITIASQRSKDEIILEDDELQRSTINVESFVDEQEWRLYDEVETFKGSVSKFYEGDDAENCIHPTFSCRTHATRRSGFYTTNIFVVMVSVFFLTKTRGRPLGLESSAAAIPETKSKFEISKNSQK